MATIVADCNPGEDIVVAALRSHGFFLVQRKRLPVGDYQVSYGDSAVVLIERKTLDDWRSSMIDGRLESQRARADALYKESGVKLVYLLEGGVPNWSSEYVYGGCVSTDPSGPSPDVGPVKKSPRDLVQSSEFRVQSSEFRVQSLQGEGMYPPTRVDLRRTSATWLGGVARDHAPCRLRCPCGQSRGVFRVPTKAVSHSLRTPGST